MFLRSNTFLGPIAKLRIMETEDSIEKFRMWYLKMEGELIESDYTPALELEYELRLKSWQNKCIRRWKQNSDGLDLSDFADNVIYDSMKKKKVLKRK